MTKVELGQIEAICVHNLDPRGHEVIHELLARIVRGVQVGERPQDRVRSEHEVVTGGCPLLLSRIPIGALEDCLLYTSPSPRDRQKSRMPSSA